MEVSEPAPPTADLTTAPLQLGVPIVDEAERSVLSPPKRVGSGAAGAGVGEAGDAMETVAGEGDTNAPGLIVMADWAQNFPIAGEGQVALIVKVYDQHVDSMRIGDVLDVIGVLSFEDVGAEYVMIAVCRVSPSKQS